MINQTEFTLLDPRTKTLVFQLFDFDDAAAFEVLRHHPYYSVMLVTEGEGMLDAGLSSFNFKAGSLLCLSLYEPFRIVASNLKGTVIHFHPTFFCIYKHEEEVAANGVLFNNSYQSPVISLADIAPFEAMLSNVRLELKNQHVSQYEMLTAYLKIFLISAVRLKVIEQQIPLSNNKEPFILQTLKDAIEDNYRKKRSPAAYADLLNITSKALNRISKKHLNKTLTDLIAERVVIEAKRELYLSGKPVKQIAYESGFNDEFYFSRFFKSNAQVSPQVYRDTVGFAKG